MSTFVKAYTTRRGKRVAAHNRASKRKSQVTAAQERDFNKRLQAAIKNKAPYERVVVYGRGLGKFFHVHRPHEALRRQVEAATKRSYK